MVYLLTQIILCLLVAYLLGALITWLFMRNVRSRTARETRARAAASTGRLEVDLAAAREGMERYRDRAHALEKDLASLRERMDALRRDMEAEKRPSGDVSTRAQELEAEASTLRDEAAKAADAAKNAAARAGELDALVNSQKGKLASLEAEVAGLADLRRELDAVRASLRQRDERIASLEREVETGQRADIPDASWSERVQTLEADLQERDVQVKALSSDLSKTRTDCAAALERKDAEIAQLRSGRSELGTRAEEPRRRSTAKKPKQPDDLKRIKGVGVVLERLLHKNGVYTFQEIANWTPEDVARIDAKLERFSGRIKRDNWIAQAKKLLKE